MRPIGSPSGLHTVLLATCRNLRNQLRSARLFDTLWQTCHVESPRLQPAALWLHVSTVHDQQISAIASHCMSASVQHQASPRFPHRRAAKRLCSFPRSMFQTQS